MFIFLVLRSEKYMRRIKIILVKNNISTPFWSIQNPKQFSFIFGPFQKLFFGIFPSCVSFWAFVHPKNPFCPIFCSCEWDFGNKNTHKGEWIHSGRGKEIRPSKTKATVGVMSHEHRGPLFFIISILNNIINFNLKIIK